MTARGTAFFLGVLFLGQSGMARAGAPLETETARIPPQGTLTMEGAFEYQHSGDGSESALPFAFEYAATPRLLLLFEPVPFTRISPRIGDAARGVGDFEATAIGLIAPEAGHRPALALAGEAKIPTAKDRLIGSGKYDYTAYLIASKRAGPFDLHANLGYTFVGHASSLAVGNTVNYALAAEYSLRQKVVLAGEIVGNTAAISERGSATENAVAPEISGGETVGTLGFRWSALPWLSPSLGVAVDNNGAVLLRTGLAFRL